MESFPPASGKTPSRPPSPYINRRIPELNPSRHSDTEAAFSLGWREATCQACAPVENKHPPLWRRKPDPNKMQPQEFEDAKLLWKTFYAGECFKHAHSAAEFVFQNAIAENNPVFYPLITAVYVLYGKPFLNNYGVGKLNEDIVPAEYLNLHKTLLEHRNQIYAHSDAKGFELPDVGNANQVRLVRHQTDKSLFCSQFQAGHPLMPHIINLCQQLHEKAKARKLELFKQYEKHVPAAVGEYVLNIDEPSGDFFKPANPVIEIKERE